MKGLKKKLVLCVATAFALFLAFIFPFGFVPVLAEETENTANYESVLDEAGKEHDDVIPETGKEHDDVIPETGGILPSIGDIIPETVASEWFKENVVPYIWKFLTAAAGALCSMLLFLKKHDVKLGELINACNVLKTANDNNEKTKQDVAQQYEFLQEWTTSQNEERKKWQESQTAAMLEGIKQIREEVRDRIEDACDTAHKILEVEEIAYKNNPLMVSEGTAAKIEEVIHNGTEKKNEPDNES